MMAADTIGTTLKKDVGVLMAWLKQKVDGRHKDAFARFDSLVEGTNLPSHLAFNIIESRAIEHLLHRHGAVWFGTPGHVIKVPVDFGHQL